jgi:hypothetical protein
MHGLLSASPNLGLLSHLRQQGFDEFMNLVIDDAVEVYVKEAKPRRELGKLRQQPPDILRP